ncbi:MAG: MBOAT family O-acyltransferase, partial [Rhodospirillales bacterium]
MLFHAPEFLLLFLPVVLAGFALLEATGQRRWLVPWLTVASLVFYGRWRIEDLGLFVGMLAINWWLAGVIARSGSRAILLGAVAFDLAVLGWFKYLHFASEVLSSATGLDWTVKAVILPLGISFFTFQMIAHLVDAADGESHERSPVTYALFIAFFPQLIAGPIVHHKEMVPQFADPARFGFRVENLAVGLSILSVGLFKKVVLADGVAGYVNAGFADAAEGTALTLLEAWAVSVAFAFQIYFDFSGYSDMAVGLARMFGVRLPTNFASPYRAPSIIEFWARWHVTLTRFLTTYVYNPVAMALNRRRMERGLPRLTRGTPTPGAFLVLLALPTMLTMGLAGVWHGAGWQFVAFGLLHGTFLVTNHLWRALRPALRLTPQQGWGGGAWSKPLGVAVTFACVVVALVFFRAEGVDHALGIIGGMVGL